MRKRFFQFCTFPAKNNKKILQDNINWMTQVGTRPRSTEKVRFCQRSLYAYICVILTQYTCARLNSLFSTWSSTTACTGGSRGGVNLKTTMMFTKQLNRMNSEFENLIGSIDAFCNCKNTEQNIEKYNESKQNGKRGKQSQKGPQRNKTEIIPIQLVTEMLQYNTCKIVANSISTMIVANDLQSNSLMPEENFLKYIQKTFDYNTSLDLKIPDEALSVLPSVAPQPKKTVIPKEDTTAKSTKS